jgi:hypothetical protein
MMNIIVLLKFPTHRRYIFQKNENNKNKQLVWIIICIHKIEQKQIFV